jgi:hypothetical protein
VTKLHFPVQSRIGSAPPALRAPSCRVCMRGVSDFLLRVRCSPDDFAELSAHYRRFWRSLHWDPLADSPGMGSRENRQVRSRPNATVIRAAPRPSRRRWSITPKCLSQSPRRSPGAGAFKLQGFPDIPRRMPQIRALCTQESAFRKIRCGGAARKGGIPESTS